MTEVMLTSSQRQLTAAMPSMGLVQVGNQHFSRVTGIVYSPNCAKPTNTRKPPIHQAYKGQNMQLKEREKSLKK